MNPIFFCLCVATLALTVSVARAEDDKRVRIGYRLDQPGSISVAVYNSKGRLVRELCRGERQAAGEHFIYWDGLDQSGAASRRMSLEVSSHAWFQGQLPTYSWHQSKNAGVGAVDGKPFRGHWHHRWPDGAWRLRNEKEAHRTF